MSILYVRHAGHPLVNLTLFAESGPDREIRLVAVTFGIHRKYGGRTAVQSRNTTLKKYADMIIGFLDGTVKDLSAVKVSIKSFTDFQQRVLRAARSIPYGKTVSYSELAQMSGKPKAVRAVASVMRNNPLPLIIPCHRVIQKNGALGGFGGQMRGAKVNLKKKLIQNEQA